MTVSSEKQNRPEPEKRESFPYGQKEEKAESGSRRIILLSSLLTFLILAVAMASYWFGRTSFFVANVIPSGNTKTLITEEVLSEQIRQLARFVSVEYYMSDIIEHKEVGGFSVLNSRIPFPMLDKRVLIIAKAKVLAGFDLDKGINIRTERNDRDYRADVYITLPPPEILSVEPDYRYYDIQGPVLPEIHTMLLDRAKKTLRSAAVREGILDKAKESMLERLPFFFPSCRVHVIFSRKAQETEGGEKENRN